MSYHKSYYKRYTPGEKLDIQKLYQSGMPVKQICQHKGYDVRSIEALICREKWARKKRPPGDSIKWTDELDNKIIKMRAQGLPNKYIISVILNGKHKIAVQNRIQTLIKQNKIPKRKQ